MPPFADYVLRTLRELARASAGPVRTAILADCLGIPERTARWYARLLEINGLVERRSPRSGWLPVAA